MIQLSEARHTAEGARGQSERSGPIVNAGESRAEAAGDTSEYWTLKGARNDRRAVSKRSIEERSLSTDSGRRARSDSLVRIVI